MADPFLRSVYDRLHTSPMQQKFRRLAPIPAGVVFIQSPGMSREDIRAHFHLIRELGFNCLKGLYLLPGEDRRAIEHMAMDEGLIPWWYGEGGYEEISEALLGKLGIDASTPMAEIRKDPHFVAYQEKVIRRRIDREATDTIVPTDARPRFPFSFDAQLAPESSEHFGRWLEKTYVTVDRMLLAWNMNRAIVRRPSPVWETWEQVRGGVWELLRGEVGEYRRLRDVLRYKADVYLEMVRERAEANRAMDVDAPARAGGEMGLFLPFAARATDMEGVADAMTETGSFYPSIHLAWHFEEVGFEVVRPIYMQASMAHDWFKGGWSATWESTGGPQQLSGGKAHLYPAAAPYTAGFTVDGGTISQLMLSYLAAGFKGFGLWCWNSRTFGWEAGEYALLDRQNRPTDRAATAGRIARAANIWRDELWQGCKEPVVGIFQDWDNEAYWAVMAIGGRDHFKHVPIRGRIGASRACINGNIPFEYVTATDLRQGLAGRYRVIYLSAVIALSSDLMPIFEEFVRHGGRLVMDLPAAWYDEFGRMLDTARGSAFERLFGCTIRDFQYSSNRPRCLEGGKLHGFVADLEATSAEVVERYDEGSPSVTENRLGDGSALILGYEASLACCEAGNVRDECRLLRRAIGAIEIPYTCNGAIVYRLASELADHYFLMNDRPVTTVRLDIPRMRYRTTMDAVTNEPVDVQKIELPAYSGRWLRYEK